MLTSCIQVPIAEVRAWQARGYVVAFTMPGGWRLVGETAVMRRVHA